MWLAIFGFLLFLSALFLFWQANRARRAAGLPGGRVIYTDTRAWQKTEKPLYDPLSGLTGKPDYLVQLPNGKIIPVEVKSGKGRSAPYDSHIFQAAAYCLLVEKTSGKRPPYAIIHYPDADFAIDYTPSLETALLDLLAEMRRDERKREIPRSHENPRRCAGCGFREVCEEKL